MNSITSSALVFFFLTIVASRSRSFALRWNRYLVWLPSIGNLACLLTFLFASESASTRFLLSISVLSGSLLLNLWSALSGHVNERKLHALHFVSLQSLLLILPIAIPRVEMTVVSWLGTSWLWLCWSRSDAPRETWKWGTPAAVLTDSVFFVGFYLVYAAGMVGSYEWHLPTTPSPTLTAGILTLWISCIFRASLCGLAALIDDSKNISDAEDLPLLFMQAAGFALPGAYLLLDPDLGMSSSLFASIAPVASQAIYISTLFALVCAVVNAVMIRRTRAAANALCISSWCLWLVCLTGLQQDWLLVFAFQNAVGLCVLCILSLLLEHHPSSHAWMRRISQGLFAWFALCLAMLFPWSGMVYSLTWLETTNGNYALIALFYLLTASTSFLAARLLYVGTWWADPSTDTRNLFPWLLETLVCITVALFLCLDISILSSIETTGLSFMTALKAFSPLIVPFFLGYWSAQMLPPAAPVTDSRPRFSNHQWKTNPVQRSAEWSASFVWSIPLTFVRSSSRAMATSGSAAIWFALTLGFAAFALRRVLF